MSELVANCPRCKAQRITFDLTKDSYIYTEYNWKHFYEAFCICRQCNGATIFVLSVGNFKEKDFIYKNGIVGLANSVNNYMRIERFVSIADFSSYPPPEHLPESIQSAFMEGAKCISVGCNNAAAAMFRLCIDLATKSILPEDHPGLNNKIRSSLGLRLDWMFKNNYLPVQLEELADCIKKDGNDGAHDGTIEERDAEDLLDFTCALLERLYTEPEKLRLAKISREKRKKKDP